ncbi:11637_t:CDS:2 [Ambispora leptoticha]|uniref:11637_t:CDS:1 n=1 Tax=Ambispora leptoticha TaxID=144679 RepID=A0A9N9CPV1_9GLOM|nr:11637_t:CDS:2 [Ambispora leptoticha]
MSSQQKNVLYHSKYDLTNREGIAPPPHKRLIQAVIIDTWVTKWGGPFWWSSFTEYQITTVFRAGDGSIGKSVTRKRYREFLALYQKLATKYGWIRLPPFPDKQYFGNNDPGFIERRRFELTRFLQMLANWRDNDVDVVSFLNIASEHIIKNDNRDYSINKIPKRGCLRNSNGLCTPPSSPKTTTPSSNDNEETDIVVDNEIMKRRVSWDNKVEVYVLKIEPYLFHRDNHQLMFVDMRN